jgi:hypothetical protein
MRVGFGRSACVSIPLAFERPLDSLDSHLDIMACPFSFLVRACFLHPNTERAGGSFDQLKWRDDMGDNANPVRSTCFTERPSFDMVA